MQSFACRRSAFSLLSVAIFAVALAQSATASSVVVGTCKSLPTYPTIQLAVNSVPAGSTIFICPGTYPEQVLITKNMTLTGVASNGLSGSTAAGAGNPVVTTPAGGMVANASDLYDGSPIAAQIAAVTPAGAPTPIKVTVQFLAIDGSNNQLTGCGTDLVGIYYQNASGTINQNATRFQELAPDLFGCQDGLAIYVESGYDSGGSAVVTVSNNSVHDYDKNGITADGSGTVATITSNYVVGIGATPLIAQNGIQVSDGATGSVKANTVTDDVYVNPDGGPYYSATGILLYDSGTVSAGIMVSGNTVSNSQGGIVTYGDSFGTADNNTISANKVTTSPAAGPYQLDGIDMCSNHNTATSNFVYNSSGAGVHIDSQCTESTGASGNNSTVTKNTINEACAGVLTGNGAGNMVGGSGNLNITYNVVQVTQTGDSCPAGAPKHAAGKLKPQPRRR
jgi:parallel beta-helix repeat protein